MKKTIWISVVILSIATIAGLLIRAATRPKHRYGFEGWVCEPGDHVDLNRDGLPDVRRAGDVLELRSKDAWIPFSSPSGSFLWPRWVRCGGSGPKHPILFLQASNGETYKFCAVDDSDFSVFSGPLPKSLRADE